jgi:nucleoside-diphosphate-sugar epimerase
MPVSDAPQRVALVTGATGFIGWHLVQRLGVDGWTVHALVRNSTHPQLGDQVVCHPIPGDAADLVRLVCTLAPSVCFHLATDFRAQHAPADVTAMIETNVTLGTRLAEALTQAARCPLVYAGTAWQHFEGRSYSPTSLYAATKQALEDILAFYAEVQMLPVATLKFFDTYGPGDSRPKLVPLLLAAAHSGEPLDLSSGDQIVDLLHVDDAVECLLAVAAFLFTSGSSGVFSAHSDNPVTVRRLVALLADATGRSVPVHWGAKPSRPREMLTPWRFAARVPDWRPRITLEDGLRSLADTVERVTSHPTSSSPGVSDGQAQTD